MVAAFAVGCIGPAPTASPNPTPTQVASASQTPPPPTQGASPTPDSSPSEPPPSTCCSSEPPTPGRTPLGTFTPIRHFRPDTGMAAELGPRLQEVIDQQQAETGSPAVGAAIAFPDGSIWSSASGLANIATGQAATGDTPFVVGSISKTFVAAAILQLVDEGRLSLDDPLAKFLPDYPNSQNITIRQLLHHTSGIYDYFAADNYDALVFGSMEGHSWTPDEILRTFAHEPYFPPGTGYHYSNTNFILLGQIIEQLTGQTLGDVYRQRFFDQVGMDATYFQGAGPPPPTAAEGYLERANGLKEQSDGTDYRPTISAATVAWAGGAIDGSAHDIALWGDALYGGHLVSPESLAQIEDWTYYPPPIDETYGLGTRSREIEGERVFGHTGSVRGFDAAMWHFPETDMTISVLTNLGRIEANPIVDALAAVAYPAANGTGVAGPSGRLHLARVLAAPSAVADAVALQATLDEQRVNLNIPGAAAAVIFPDGSIWKSGSGLAQIDPDEAATAQVPFVIGSITKTFVTAAVMQLVDEGTLTLDDPLSNWLPDYPGADLITLRELLGHTSGVYNYFEHPTYDKRVFKTDRGHYWTPQEILDDFVAGPYFEPGTGFHYSNTGFVLLGLVIESATGLPVGKVLKRRFIKPLRLKQTYFQGNGAPPSTAAQGYLVSGQGLWHEWSDATSYRPTISAASVAWAAGGIVSSARDVAKWCAALYGGHVVSDVALAAMEDYSEASRDTYGLGTYTRISQGQRIYGHTGSLRGFDAAMWFYPDSSLTVVVLTNLGRIDVNLIINALTTVALAPTSAAPTTAVRGQPLFN